MNDADIGEGAQDVLLAVSVATRPLRIVEIGAIIGITDEDVEIAIRDLLRWKLVNRVTTAEDTSPSYSLNSNTRRLVQKTYSADARVVGYGTAFRSLSGERVPEAKSAAIGRIIKQASELVFRGQIENAAEQVKSMMTEELSDSPDLYGTLGWIYSRDTSTYAAAASEAFLQAHRLGTKKEDTYYHWASMEKEIAESITFQESDEVVVGQWQACAKAAEAGVSRAGRSDALCYLIGYAKSREAKCLQRLNRFVPSQSAFGQAKEWFSHALNAPRSTVHSIWRGSIYRGLVISLDGIGSVDELARAMREWKATCSEDYYYGVERQRVLKFRPDLVGHI